MESKMNDLKYLKNKKMPEKLRRELFYYFKDDKKEIFDFKILSNEFFKKYILKSNNGRISSRHYVFDNLLRTSKNKIKVKLISYNNSTHFVFSKKLSYYQKEIKSDVNFILFNFFIPLGNFSSLKSMKYNQCISEERINEIYLYTIKYLNYRINNYLSTNNEPERLDMEKSDFKFLFKWKIMKDADGSYKYGILFYIKEKNNEIRLKK